MDREKAIRLLEMLRRRTEARGATAAEAAQAAELASKIAERYGLDKSNFDSVQRVGVELGQKQMPRWGIVLALAIAKRFKLQSHYIAQRGLSAKVVFSGPEHLVGVACWLFRAIEIDMRRAVDREMALSAICGSDRVRFRNEFCKSCVWAVYRRLIPVTTEVATKQNATCVERKATKKKHKLPSKRDVDAWLSGTATGETIRLSTDVLGGSEPLRLEAV
jgi:hypothetical protein